MWHLGLAQIIIWTLCKLWGTLPNGALRPKSFTFLYWKSCKSQRLANTQAPIIIKVQISSFQKSIWLNFLIPGRTLLWNSLVSGLVEASFFRKWEGSFLYSPFYKFFASMTPNLQIRNKSCAPELLVISTIIIAQFVALLWTSLFENQQNFSSGMFFPPPSF